MQEYGIVLGSCSFRESWAKSGSTVKDLEALRWEGFVFLLVSPECTWRKERLTWSSVVPHG